MSFRTERQRGRRAVELLEVPLEQLVDRRRMPWSATEPEVGIEPTTYRLQGA